MFCVLTTKQTNKKHKGTQRKLAGGRGLCHYLSCGGSILCVYMSKVMNLYILNICI